MTDAGRPMVSVVMPVRNEAATIERCLRAVLEQDYPAGLLEVIVADGMSTDETRAIIESVGKGAARVIDNPGRIVPTGLNAALRVAKGDVIVRVDGHCVVAPDYVSACVAALDRTGADNVGGAQRAVGEGLIGRAIAVATTTPFGTGNAAFRHEDREGWVDTVYLGAFRRGAFDLIGGFDEELVRTQDGELNARLRQAGGRIWLDPSIRVTYFPRGSLRSLWRQYFQYGVYKVRLAQKRGGLPAPRQLVPPIFALGTIGSIVLAAVTRRPVWALAVLGPYALANGLATLAAARRDPRVTLVLPVVFADMHLAWGLGFLAGLWRWRQVPFATWGKP